jgi:membrane associated rhomboid family serine protease
MKVPQPVSVDILGYNGVFLLILVNILIYIGDHIAKFEIISNYLYLWHNEPSVWQFLTATFCHSSYDHLASNLFFTYIFGKLVEEERGSLAVTGTYFLCGILSNIASYLILPR